MAGASLRDRLVDFVRDVGLDVCLTAVDAGFLPGLDIGHGAVLLDAERLLYPGDILHEAGHLAVAAPETRGRARLDPDGGDEMAAIAWSFAAARHLRLDPAIVFHPDGYKGAGRSICENFTAGRYFGVPLLAHYRMTIEPDHARSDGPEPYPHMLRWLR